MSGRDRERERDRRAAAAASARTNEYFVPKDGIDREVITADICRYLGNDALVRPGNYENPQTRQVQAGYFITAYRNLTTAMIADLKADSERWEAERRQTAGRGQPSNVEYRASTTHQSRQYYGPTEAAPGMSTPGYPSSTPSSVSSSAYDAGYAQSGYSQPISSTYANTPSGYSQQDYYVAGANYRTSGQPMDIDTPSSRAPNSSSSGTMSRTAQPYSATPAYAPRDSSSNYYSPQSGPTSSVSSSQYPQPPDPYYGRGPHSSAAYDSQDVYDSRAYQDTSSYNQPPISSNPAPPSGGRPRGERERGEDRERRHHRQR